MNEQEALQAFADKVKEGVSEIGVGLYDQRMAQFRNDALDLVQAGDFIFHSIGPDMVVPAVAEMAAKVAEGEVSIMATIFGHVTLMLIDLEHEAKLLRQQIAERE